MQVNRASKCS